MSIEIRDSAESSLALQADIMRGFDREQKQHHLRKMLKNEFQLLCELRERLEMKQREFSVGFH